MKKILFASLSIAFFAQANIAQANALVSLPAAKVMTAAAPTDLIFLDPETKTVFVDVKSLDGAASELKVKDASGKVIFTKDLANSRTDDMIEVDMSNYPKGSYVVELSTYSKTVTQEIVLQ